MRASVCVCVWIVSSEQQKRTRKREYLINWYTYIECWIILYGARASVWVSERFVTVDLIKMSCVLK